MGIRTLPLKAKSTFSMVQPQVSPALLLLLPGAHPGRIVPLCNADTGVSEQDGYLLQRHTLQEKPSRKGVAEPVSMAVGHLGQLK